MHSGKAYSHGATSAARLQSVLNRARPGNYVLHVAGQETPTRITVG